ncbi:hypothetical protein ACSL103130_12845 [Actinomyces slackii]|uniref:Uncharacterized protein n=1 Tax=Actinomyces slackii TaxID=52774 RepID=A0A448KC15_9ACTO|nr:hypothetical protein [Actinomyces slackii]VEG74471.1 Uncharacterised protein [Actinomyces slackii]
MTKRSLSDIRAVIAGALGLIGLFLLACALLATDASELSRTGGINANLWSGLGLLGIAVGMGAWWLIRPVPGGSSDAADD